ncbi:MAG: Mfa1 family fimbria major subunit [Bacteroidales bacterium]|jgi:hypothetical protein|nr:Mfa1 family fimbria major subunit [Bacteroidales bacterium]
MKNQVFLTLAFFGLLFASCNKDTENDTDNDIATSLEGDAWISLSINSTSNNTRALNGEITGTPAETTIGTVRAIFFDTGLEVTADVPLTAQAGNIGQPTGTPGDAFKVPATSAHVLIVANPPASFGVRSEGDLFSAVNTALTDAASVVAADDKFMMSNAKGDLEPTDNSTGALETLTLYTNATAAKNNALSINIDRVVAKVRVNISNINTAAIVDGTGWVLNVTNKKFFPVSKRAKTYLEGTARGCITPYDQYKIGSYRVDPNYDNTNIGVWSTADYALNYNYYLESSAPAAGDWKVSGGSDYCHENTQEKTYNMHAYTTQLLVKTNFAPASFVNPGSTAAETNASATIDWMRINNGFYSFTTLKNWIEDELTGKYSGGAPDSHTTPISTTVNAYLASISSTVSIPLPTAAEYADPPYSNTVANVIDAFNTDWATIQADIVAAGAASSNGFVFYNGGLNYYKVMIKHDNSDADDVVNEFGEFGVVRNSVYDVNITAFNNPGYPTIPAPDPNAPDEDEKVWLSVQINVNPWTWYTQNEIL